SPAGAENTSEENCKREKCNIFHGGFYIRHIPACDNICCDEKPGRMAGCSFSCLWSGSVLPECVGIGSGRTGAAAVATRDFARCRCGPSTNKELVRYRNGSAERAHG